jgi:hypothetical protein
VEERWRRARGGAVTRGGGSDGGGRVGWRRRCGGGIEEHARFARALVWVKFDGVDVAHELKLRTWVPTFLIL